MTDLSLPPMTPPRKAGAAAPDSQQDAARAGAFSWPTPPFAGYPQAGAPGQAEPCAIEGLNGKLISGRLLGFSPADELASVQIPPHARRCR
ncbi:hypothetical protein [Methylibium sp. T29]|uniref:hypothetical protein n=1 Tax=Methylibium sp. T29 TaxID=1430884 RepID=UPI0003F40799|nr:hypothetical protein [Methylibium sp. T29]EWS53475.1 Type II secretory pathway, ATPase PulE/Tfp pilus assembly pathway, ATPase PilB [Methylibium sp. T29]